MLGVELIELEALLGVDVCDWSDKEEVVPDTLTLVFVLAELEED